MKLVHKTVESPDWEIVERKCVHHPDTLADDLAETLSIAYSKYTLNEFGAVLHHNFDKTAILGGATKVSYGGGELVKPVRVVLNGRASRSFGGTVIPLTDILHGVVYDFFTERFGDKVSKEKIRILHEVSTSSSPGAVDNYSGEEDNPRHTWFAPRSLSDLPELKSLNCNDTSAACYTPPNSALSRYVLDLDARIRSSAVNFDGRIGGDMKIMGVRRGESISITVAVPLLAEKIHSIDEFFDTLSEVDKFIRADFESKNGDFKLDLMLNPLDNRKTGDVYLTHTGSCMESGDEGVVGRGNRVGGLIRINRPMTMEGVAGKNPVYHTGKVLSAAAYEIMSGLFEPLEASLYLVGQRGKSLQNPWQVVLEAPAEYSAESALAVENRSRAVLADLSEVTRKILNREIRLY